MATLSKWVRQWAAGSFLCLVAHSTAWSQYNPPPLDVSKPPAALAETFVKTYGLEKLKSKRIAITSFGVEFNQKLHASATTRNLSTDRYFNSRTDLLLAGVDDALMQRVADRAYADMVAALKARGFEVIDKDTLTASATYQALVKDSLSAARMELDYKLDKRFDISRDVHSVVVAPAGLQYYEAEVDEEEGRGPAGDNMLGVIGNLSKNLGAKTGRKVRMKEVDLAKELGANVLKARLVVGFGDASASVSTGTVYKTDWINERVSQKLLVSNSNKVRSRLSLLGRGETYIAIRTAEANYYGAERGERHGGSGGLLSKMIIGTEYDARDGNITLWLGDSLDSGESFLAESVSSNKEPEKKEATGFGLFKKLGSIVTGATESGGSGSDGATFTATADPDIYEYLASAYIDLAKQMFVSKLSPPAQ